MFKFSKIEIIAIGSTLLLIIWVGLLLKANLTVLAQCVVDNGTFKRADGLISSVSVNFGGTQNFGNSNGNCIIGNQAEIPGNQARFRVDTFDELYSQYYEHSNASRTARQEPLYSTTLSQTQDPINASSKVYYYSGPAANNGLVSLSVNNNSILAGSTGVAVVFVNGDLNIVGDITYQDTNPNAGLVFIVKGKINIAYTVQTIDAVLISNDYICTACDINGGSASIFYDGADGSTPKTKSDLLLNINGSLVSLDATKSIKFNRSYTYALNTQPIEKINAQPKYLVILKDLMSQTLKLQQETQ